MSANATSATAHPPISTGIASATGSIAAGYAVTAVVLLLLTVPYCLDSRDIPLAPEERPAAFDWSDRTWTGEVEVHDAGAFLTTITTRLCLDVVKSARARREVYVGP